MHATRAPADVGQLGSPPCVARRADPESRIPGGLARATAVRLANDLETSNDRIRTSPAGDCDVDRIDTEEYIRQKCQIENKKLICTYM